MPWADEMPQLGLKLLSVFLFSLCFLLHGDVHGELPDPPGQVARGQEAKFAAYLFAHMTHDDYGRLYYSVSRDGLHWHRLNRGKRVFDDYRGHPDVCRGHDGQFYLVGNRNDESLEINFWTSPDLIQWRKYSSITPSLKNVPHYAAALPRIGAPKLYFDEPSQQYVVTWHTPHDLGETNLPEPYWVSQRTLYVTSPNLKTFSDPPRRLFDFEMATIDVILRRERGQYFAIIKDERYPALDWTTGKTIRICRAEKLLGPYSEPGPPLSPNFREAPTLIPAPNGQAWYLYYEQYPGVSYGLSASDSLSGKWYQVSGNTHFEDWDKYEVPSHVRHGSMLPITGREYERLIDAFGVEGGTGNDAE